MKNVWKDLTKPIMVLAPMDNVTDTVFRRIIGGCAAPDMYFTEFMSVDGYQSKGKDRVKNKILFTDKEKPLIAQIWGLKPENYFKTTKQLVKLGFDGVDINMGCPERVVVKNGCCSALINNRPLAGEIIEATKEGTGGKIPVSVKCRTGFSKVDTTWHEFLLGFDLDALIVHGRTTKEMSKVPNRWDLIEDIRKMRDNLAPETALLGNGDVDDRHDAEKLTKKHGLDGVMMGRAVFRDPYVFSKKSPWEDMLPEEKIGLFRKHVELFRETWGDSKNPAVLKKFAKIYVSDFDGASTLRVNIMQQTDIEGLLEAAHL